MSDLTGDYSYSSVRHARDSAMQSDAGFEKHGGVIGMLWEVIVPNDDGAQSAPITVEADNWFSALRGGLTKHGLGGQGVSTLLVISSRIAVFT